MQKNLKKHLLLGIVFILVTAACGKMDNTYKEYIEDGERIYAGRVLDVYTLSGNEMVTAVWKIPTDPDINEFRIFWDERRDSLSVPFNRQSMASADSLVVEIKPLVANTYYFEIYSYDTEGKRSVRTEFTGTAYPADYEIEKPADEETGDGTGGDETSEGAGEG
ncbi:DUF4998 domain-containing protein [Parapedobacter sp.]